MAATASKLSRACCLSKGQAISHTCGSFAHASRNLTTSAVHGDSDIGSDGELKGKNHLLDKHGESNNPQSAASKIAHKEKEEGNSNSAAISQKDLHKSKDKAKLEFPEAPDPFLGAHDERGGKQY